MGDKNYKWWVGYAEDAETFSGPYDDREEAIQVGREQHEGDFYIVEADKTIMGPNFDGEAHAESIMEDLCENNGDCFGEDGPEDPWAHLADAHRTLGSAIEKAVKEWLSANAGKTWAFDDMRNGEYIKQAPAA